MYSQIPNFETLRTPNVETLRTRFHNQFMCLTPLQVIERLKNAKRIRGMPAEVWGDLISGLCNEAHCYDPQMRYKYFLSGLRNREWKAALNTPMVNSIEQAVIALLAKNMHQPVEDDSDFADEIVNKTPSENMAMMQMMQMLQQTQNLLLHQQQELTRSPRSPRRSSYAAAAIDSQDPQAPIQNVSRTAQPTVPQAPLRGIRQGPDPYTQEGQVACGRCHILGCSRINRCRLFATCPHCMRRGHIGVECGAQPPQFGGGTDAVSTVPLRDYYDMNIAVNLTENLEKSGLDHLESSVRLRTTEPRELPVKGPDPIGNSMGTLICEPSVIEQTIKRSDDPSYVNSAKEIELIVNIADKSTDEKGNGDDSRSAHDRLFTSEKLDALEEGLPFGVKDEKEEYDKELEERLFPLDEVELKKKMTVNSERKRELSLEELSTLLNVSVEILNRTREASSDERTNPEYWIAWYSKKLATSEEAMRAYRDFSKPNQPPEGHPRIDAIVSEDADWRDVGGGGDLIGDEIFSRVSSARDGVTPVAEDTVVGNICVSFAELEHEALGFRASHVEGSDAISHYVCPVRDPEICQRLPGLVGKDETYTEPADDDASVPEEKRIICSVGGLEALSAGYVENLPVNLLIDSGAVASLVDSRVLKRLGLSTTSLRPYDRSLKDVSGKTLRIQGEVDLNLRLGAVEMLRTVDSGEIFTLGAPRVEEMHMTRIASAVRLRPGGQALVVTDVMGQAPESASVLIEGLPELDANVKIARTLCTIREGKTIVEICNASLEELVIKRGTALAAATIVPESAFSSSSPQRACPEADRRAEARRETDESEWIDAVLSSVAMRPAFPAAPMDDLDKVRETELEVDFSDSKLNDEPMELFRGLLCTFRDMFVETSLMPGRTDLLEFSINTGTHPPIKQRQYRVSQAEGDVMEAEIQQYLELGLIRPSTSRWATPVLMVRKPDGGIRFCIDYRRLNAVTAKVCYPMPLIDDIPDVLAGAKIFSTMDIASGYWNVPMAAKSVEKTAFTCKYGLFEWLVMPFGLCNAVPAFERLMENVLIDLKWRTCLVYLDDCVVFSSDFATHLVRLKQVLERFRTAGFKLKMKKCRWGRDQVAFLGHIVTPSGILPNPEKVKAVINVARPYDLHTV
ncbi:unnamed protein product [Phytophthora fragariaefolia]|uniref:Unnamed protein product n=1 Tax=Phytophthora fragariaefolia TaxID=1490495 RepID=A0A9W6UBY1_9STRA|nr:unnamed protein product [Phytophthora fragariaefolia]